MVRREALAVPRVRGAPENEHAQRREQRAQAEERGWCQRPCSSTAGSCTPATTLLLLAAVLVAAFLAAGASGYRAPKDPPRSRLFATALIEAAAATAAAFSTTGSFSCFDCDGCPCERRCCSPQRSR